MPTVLRILAPLLMLLVAGCAQLTRDGRGDLGAFSRVFVEQRHNDSLGVHRLLVQELRALGYDASSGWLTELPGDAQLIVTYDARETWDFRPYMIELNTQVRPARDYHRVVATARYFRPGVTAKSPEAMVRDLTARLFPPARR